MLAKLLKGRYGTTNGRSQVCLVASSASPIRHCTRDPALNTMWSGGIVYEGTQARENRADWWAFPLQSYILSISTGIHWSSDDRHLPIQSCGGPKAFTPPLWFLAPSDIPSGLVKRSKFCYCFWYKPPDSWISPPIVLRLNQRLKIVVRLHATERLLRSLLVVPLPVNSQHPGVTILTASLEEAAEIKGSRASPLQAFSAPPAGEHLHHHSRRQLWPPQLRAEVTASGQASVFVLKVSARALALWLGDHGPEISQHESRGLLSALLRFHLCAHLHWNNASGLSPPPLTVRVRVLLGWPRKYRGAPVLK